MNKEALNKEMTVYDLAILMMAGFDRMEKHFEDRLTSSIDSLKSEMRQGFKQVNDRIDTCNSRIDECNNRISETNRRLDRVEYRLKNLEINHNARLEIIEEGVLVM